MNASSTAASAAALGSTNQALNTNVTQTSQESGSQNNLNCTPPWPQIFRDGPESLPDLIIKGQNDGS